jgi:succinate dehydrogenase assembly factor 2
VSNAPPIDPPSGGEMGVGELEGAKFKIEPLRRVGEDEKTMRARLVCKSQRYGPAPILLPKLPLGSWTE